VGRTLAEKILSTKSGSEARAGDIVVAEVDLAFVQDTTGPLTVRQFRAAGFQNMASSLSTAFFLDHAAPSQSRELSNDHMLLREFARESGGLLSDVGLSHRLDHRPSELSGGEAQRVAIARALANRPEVLLLDEPTGNLDSSTAEEIIELVERLNKERGLTALMVTHEEDAAGAVSHSIIRLFDGMIESGASRGRAE